MTHLQFPPPVDAPAFERLMSELAVPVLSAAAAELNGRQGQSQQGVDVSVALHDGRYVGIQCKVTIGSLSLKTVEEELAKAQNYKPALSRFIVATTARSDARLQEAVRALPKRFPVDIWSWDQINDWLNRYAAAGISYAQHVLLGNPGDAEQRHAEALRVALERPALLRPADTEHNFDEQFEAIRDTSAFLRTGYLYTRDRNLVTGVLPYRSYSDEYVALVTPILGALDGMDAHLRRRMRDLQDWSSLEHADAVVKLDAKRVAVLTAGNKLFVALGIDPIRIGL